MAYDSDIKLDDIQSNVDAAVSSRLGAIAGIDRGTISVSAGASNTATITTVSIGRTQVTYSCSNGNTDTAGGFPFVARGTLTNATTITASAGGVTGNETLSAILSYEAIEYAA